MGQIEGAMASVDVAFHEARRLAELACDSKEKADARNVERHFLALFERLLNLTAKGSPNETDEYLSGAQRSFWQLLPVEENQQYLYDRHYYLGELNGIAELTKLISSRMIPRSALKAVGTSKFAPRLLRELEENGPLSGRDLSERIDLPHANNLARITKPLKSNDLIARHKYGKLTFLSIMPLGSAVVESLRQLGDGGASDEMRSKKKGRGSLQKRLRELFVEHATAIDQRPESKAKELLTAIASTQPDTWDVIARAVKDRRLDRLIGLGRKGSQQRRR